MKPYATIWYDMMLLFQDMTLSTWFCHMFYFQTSLGLGFSGWGRSSKLKVLSLAPDLFFVGCSQQKTCCFCTIFSTNKAKARVYPSHPREDLRLALGVLRLTSIGTSEGSWKEGPGSHERKEQVQVFLPRDGYCFGGPRVPCHVGNQKQKKRIPPESRLG